jgi:streptogramin lyase
MDVGSTQAIGRIAPDGTISEYPTGPRVAQYGIAPGPDGNMWFTSRGKISKLTPGGQTTTYSVGLPPPSASDLGSIAAGPDDAMWFTDQGPAAIGRITLDGTVSLYSTGLSSNSDPTQIAQGPDGNMWFLDAGHGAIGRITPGGVITEFSLGHSSDLYGIAAGTDGNIWFTDIVGNMLGRVTPNGTISEFDTSSYGFAELLAIKTGSDGNIWLTGLPPNGVPAIVRVDLGGPAASAAPPEVDGSGQQGDPQSCAGALWADWAGKQPSTTAFGFDGYQWLLDGAPVPGQTAQSYTPAASDVGHQLSCKVTATYTLFPATVSATSAPVTVTASPVSGGGGGGAGTSTTPPVTTTTKSPPPLPPPVQAPAGGATAHPAATTLTVLGVEAVFLHAKAPQLHMTVKASQACKALLVLRDSKGKTVATWKLRLARGTNKLALTLPPKARHKGRDTLRLRVGGGAVQAVLVTIRA